MSSRNAHPLAGIRPSFIDIQSIYGVDFEKGTLDPHPEFPNPKTWLRDDVMQSLSSADAPDDVPPIDVFLGSDGQVVILDGTHRVLHALQRCKGDAASPWSKIKVTRFIGSVAEAQIRSALANIDFARGSLTEPEEVGMVARLMKLGLSQEEIVTRAGRNNKRWINKIVKIIEATPDVLAAVMAGELSIETGSKIADHIPVQRQAETVQRAVQSEKKKGGTQTRKDIGVRKTRLKTASVKTMLAHMWSLFEQVEAEADNMDDEVAGEWFVLMLYFGFDKTPYEDIIATLKPMYEEYTEKMNNPRGRGRPAGKKAAPDLDDEDED